MSKQQMYQQHPGSLLVSDMSSSTALLQSSCSSSGSVSHAGGSLRQLQLRINSNSNSMQAAQVGTENEAQQLRLTEMCDNHAMFQFLFDAQGQLLAANKRAKNNMRGERAAAHAGTTQMSSSSALQLCANTRSLPEVLCNVLAHLAAWRCFDRIRLNFVLLPSRVWFCRAPGRAQDVHTAAVPCHWAV